MITKREIAFFLVPCLLLEALHPVSAEILTKQETTWAASSLFGNEALGPYLLAMPAKVRGFAKAGRINWSFLFDIFGEGPWPLAETYPRSRGSFKINSSSRSSMDAA